MRYGASLSRGLNVSVARSCSISRSASPLYSGSSTNADEVERYLRSGAPVGSHLADQLLLPMALGAGGAFRTMRTTPHTKTNVEVIRRFVTCDMTIERESNDVDRVTVAVS